MNLRVHFWKTIDNLKLIKSIALVSIFGSIFASSTLLANPSTLIEQGSGSFRWFGIKVYDLRLMAMSTFSGNFLCEKKQLWATELRTICPDLKPGDTLKYQINIDDTSDFYHNQKAIGSIADRNFSSCFVSIWLTADSSTKILRKKLLGINAR